MVIRALLLVLSFLLASPSLVAATESAINERSESTELTVAGSLTLMVRKVFQKAKTSRENVLQSGVAFHHKAFPGSQQSNRDDLPIRLRRLII
mgnify:CR=1 FL=1